MASDLQGWLLVNVIAHCRYSLACYISATCVRSREPIPLPTLSSKPCLRPAVRRVRGTRRALLLITLGIDEYDCHRVQLDFLAGTYDDGAHDAVSEAIGALEMIRSQLSVMQATPGARSAEHNAFLLGVEAEQAGLPAKSDDRP